MAEYRREIHQLQDALASYCPGRTLTRPGAVIFPDTLCIGLFGRTGCGKTSLINSMRYAAQGKLRNAYWLQVAGQAKAGGHTTYRKRIEITESIAVVDNRGMDRLHATEAMEELCAQLAGTRGYSEIVSWEGTIYDQCQQLGERITTVVFVVSALHNINENVNGLAGIISIMHTTQGQYPLAVITHVDTATSDEVDEVKAVLRAQGVNDSCIFTVANLTQERKRLDEENQAQVLNLLVRCMTDGDKAMLFHHHKKCKDQELYKLQKQQMHGETTSAHFLPATLSAKVVPVPASPSASMTGIEEQKLNDISNAVGADNDIVNNLGFSLGFLKVDIDKYDASNHLSGKVSFVGTRNMLFEWKRKTSPNEQIGNLRKALIKTQLIDIAEKHLQRM